MLEQQLEKLGLHKNEAKVYLALFELGKAKAGQIIEKTALHRNLVYTALEELATKNLVTKMERGKVAVFEINNPKILQELVEEKMDAVKDVVKELQSRLHSKPRDVRVYEGNEGIISIRDKVGREIQPGEKYYVMGVSYSSANADLNEYYPKANRKLIEKGGDIRVLLVGNEDSKVVAERGLTWGKNARHLPFNVNSPMWMTLFRDTMNINLVGQDPITFSIRSQEAADGFKKYFEYFWDQKVKTETGIDALNRAIYEMLDELKPGEEYFVLGASAGDSNKDVQMLYDKFHSDRIKKGVVTNMLVYRESFDRIKKRFVEQGDEAGTLSRLKQYSTAPKIPMQINMFKGKAFMILYAEQPTVISFESQEAHDGFKAYFDQLWNQEIVVDNGMGALKKVFFEMLDELKPGEEYYVIGTGLGGDPKYKDFFLDYHRQRIKKGVVVKMLAYRDQMAAIKKDLFAAGGDPDGRVSMIKSFVDAPPIPMQITLYKNKVRIFFSGEEPTVFCFEKPEAYEGFKKYFDVFWQQDATTFTGRENVEMAYDDLLNIAKKEDDVIIFAAKPKDPVSAEFNVRWAERLSPLCRKIKYIYYGLTDENKKRAEEIRVRVKNCEVQILNTNQSLPISNVVMGNTTLNTVWSDTPVCLVTKNQMVADSLRENFELLWNQETQIVKGPLELQKLFFESIENKELKQIGARGYFMDRYPELFKEVMAKAKQTTGLKWRNIVDVGTKGHPITKLPWMETKYNLSSVKNPNVIWLYGEKVAIANWAGDEPVIFISTNRQLIQSYNDYFEELWKKGE